jgi:basic membrane protein A
MHKMKTNLNLAASLLLGLALALGLSGAGAAAEKAPVALIIAQGGLGDQSYNDLAFSGFQKALKETGLQGKPVESKDVVAQANDMLRRASDSGFGLIVDLEYSHGETLAEVAKDYPKVRYVILNQVRKGDNVTSVLFQEQEGSYLGGALAAMVASEGAAKTNAAPSIGVIGGVKSVGIDKFIAGYIQGARAVNPKIDVKIAYSNSFGDPAKGLQMAKAMYEQGVSVIYQVAGGTGAGVIQAAKETGHYAIGVDTDQDGMAPGSVLASVIKRTDVAVETVIKDYQAGSLTGESTITLGLKEGGMDLSDMKYTAGKIVSADDVAKLKEMKAKIIAGDIKVWNVVDQGYPDFMK